MILYDVFRFGHGIFFVSLQTALSAGIFLEWLRDRRARAPVGTRDAAGAAPESAGAGTRALNPKVSVIIPVHNESRRIGGLLDSLLCQDYPAELIFVDDRSADETPSMLAGFVKAAAERGLRGCRIITLKENPGPNHKQYALGRGIAEARGEFFLFTDGDCEVPPGWIRAMVRRMGDKKTGAVIGPVFKKKQGKGFFYLYQCYDHAIRYNYLAGAIGLGAAGGGFGNNLIISRGALDAAGGYDAVPPSPTEDAALISRIRSRGRYRVRAIAHPDAAVETGAEHSWRSFINQTLRWNNGGLFSPDPLTRLNYNLLMLVISTGVLALPLLPFFPGLWPLPLGVFIVMIENTLAAFGLFKKKLPRGGAAYFLTLLFTPLYFTLMTLLGYCGVKVTWKGDKL
jgi:cellulose synthase/poly-beta-1,6-N-acetylglucosamine synthase-like glycosyltransferase